MILRRGSVVEMGATDRVFGNPLHPYTRMLVASVPQLHRTWTEVEADLAAREIPAAAHRCLYHEVYPNGSSDGAPPALAEAEEDHLVACYELAQADRCSAPIATSR